MAVASKCPDSNCSGRKFEVVYETPKGSRSEYSFVRCAICGIVVGVTESIDMGNLIAKQNKAIKTIAAHIGAVVHLD
jgi:hypothetical protein